MARVGDFSFGPRSHSATVGTRPVPEDEWLQLDSDFESDLARKAELLERHRDLVLVEPAAPSPAAQELLDVVTTFARERRWPTVRGGGGPLEQASRMVQEDLCLMERSLDGAWVLTGACVCLPSHWVPREKVGRSMAQIHEPVPGYADRLQTATDKLFDRMRDTGTTEIVRRFNWTLADEAELFTPWASAAAQIWPADLTPGRVYLRVERQTLRLLPGSGAIVFTIRTGLTDLFDLPAAELAALRQTLPQVDEATARYRNWPKEYRTALGVSGQ